MSNYDKVANYINEMNLSGEDVLRALVYWHGTDIISDEFIDNQRDCEGWDI